MRALRGVWDWKSVRPDLPGEIARAAAAPREYRHGPISCRSSARPVGAQLLSVNLPRLRRFDATVDRIREHDRG